MLIVNTASSPAESRVRGSNDAVAAHPRTNRGTAGKSTANAAGRRSTHAAGKNAPRAGRSSGPEQRKPARAFAPIRYTKDASIAEIADKWLKRPELERSLVGLEVMDLKSGNVLYSANGTRRFVPASTTKVFTTACAYDLLGPNYRYRTTLTTYGASSGDKITGDLELVPSQDPTLSRADLSAMFSTVASRAKIIDGVLHVITPQGGGDSFTPGWLNEDWGQDWMPVSSDLVVDKNIFSGGSLPKGAKLIEEPASNLLSAHGRSLLRQDLSPGWFVFDPHSGAIKSYRGYPSMSGKGPLVVGNPTAFNAALAVTIAKDAGLKFSSRTKEDVHGAAPHVMAEHYSEPITRILKVTLHESDNLMAQQLLRTLGMDEPGSGAAAAGAAAGAAQSAKPGAPARTAALPGTPLEEKGVIRMMKWLAGIGVNPQELVLKDGCGLSRKNYVTPHSLNQTLRYMTNKYGESGYLSLLKGGEVRGAGKGVFRFKTGAMDSVRTITGILRTTSGRNMAVTIMVNGHQPSVRDVRTSMSVLISGLVGATVTEDTHQPAITQPAATEPAP